MVKAIFDLLGKRRKKQAVLLLPVMLLGTLLEMLGMGMVVSICALLVSEDALRSNPWAMRLCGLLHIQPGKDLVEVILLALVALYVFKLFYLTWKNYIVAKYVRTSRSEVSKRLFRDIVLAPYPFFVRHSRAEIHNLLGRDLDQLSSGLNACVQLLLEGLLAVGMGVLLLLVDPMMTVFVTAGIVFLLLLSRLILDRIIERASERQRMAVRMRWKWLQQAVAGIKDVRIGRHEDFFCDHFDQAEESFARSEYLKQFWTKLPALCIETVMVLSVLFYLLFLLLEGKELSSYLPGLSALALSAVRLLPTCNRINASLSKLGYVKTSVEGIRCAIEELELATRADLPQQSVSFTQGVCLRGVSYAYEGGAEKVLEDVDLDVPAGGAVGIIGPSGAGKTTLLDILLGLLVPKQGQVLIDGIPIDQCCDSYLRKVAYVPQTTFLLDDTVRSNVAMGQEPDQIDDERVWAALEQAALAQMVRELTDGLDAQIGEQGIRLSGGERQRLGLARAMYRDPAMIVFDEATSALDLDTEAAVLQSIAKLGKKKTLIIVSHRKSAIEHCDRIYQIRDKTVTRER